MAEVLYYIYAEAWASGEPLYYLTDRMWYLACHMGIDMRGATSFNDRGDLSLLSGVRFTIARDKETDLQKAAGGTGLGRSELNITFPDKLDLPTPE